MLRRALPILLALVVMATGTGCGTAGRGGSSDGASGIPAGARTASPSARGAVGVIPAPARTDVPEPARAPALTQAPAGTVLPMPGAPEGLAVDEPDGILAVGLRRPDAMALVSVLTGRAIPASIRSGRAWSCTASKEVTRSNRAVSPRRAASRCSKRAFGRPRRPASARAAAIPDSEKSKPVNRDRGNASAIRLTAWPDPQPTSATSMPSPSRPVSPGTSGSVTSMRVAFVDGAAAGRRGLWRHPGARVLPGHPARAGTPGQPAAPTRAGSQTSYMYRPPLTG